MNIPYRLVVFDWEGTLGDTLGKVLNTIQHEAEALGLGAFDDQKARKCLMHGLGPALHQIFPHISPFSYESLMQATQQSLSCRSMEVFLLPGARKLIEDLKAQGIDLAIASNKGQQSLLRDVQSTNLTDYFSIIRSAGQTAPKPCPQMLEEIIEFCGVSAQETLMIGDSINDVEMSVALDVKAIGVNFTGQSDLNEALLDAGAVAVFDDYEKLAEFIGLKNKEVGE